NGRKKTLLIENSGGMKEEARNSLLKLLEEPPATVNIVLTSSRREEVISTILSRLRPYSFQKRGEAQEREVIRRVFRDSKSADSLEHTSENASIIGAYLDSFLSQSREKLYPLASFFLSSIARAAALEAKKRGAAIPAPVGAMGSRYAPIAKDAGFSPADDPVKAILAKSDNFGDGSFSRFTGLCLGLLAGLLRDAPPDPSNIQYYETYKKYFNEAETAVGVLNQSPALALQSLFYKINTALAGFYG
ncbi:MAG: DNA polymerase III, partial [Treponema sp.]|nr:DNA polymerase III [Treponema sp.]